MIEFDIKSSLTSSGINPNFFIDENTVKIEDEIGKSMISQYTYDSAVLNITRFVNHDNLRISEIIEAPVLVFQYCMTGEMNLLELDGGVNALRGGDCLISVLNNHNSVGFDRNSLNTIVSILIPLESALRSIDERVMERVMSLSHENNKSIEISSFLPREKIILSEILNPPVAGGLKKIFIESKILELTAIRLSFFYEKTLTDPKSQTFSLRKDELDRIRYAAEIIAERMDDPPTISRLARISGINEFKLKTGFKVVFDSTIYDYLRNLRMEKAYNLLLDGGMNVTEAAYQVGYSKPGHFSRLFRDCYGINPGQIKNMKIQ